MAVMSVDLYHDCHNVCVSGHTALCPCVLQAALPHLKEGASIINTSSVTAFKGSPSLLDYSSTKGAQVGATGGTVGLLFACCMLAVACYLLRIMQPLINK
jgi:NAD(P)-dependent dehydrogenase (short-subunit alcohol dehydrogenase family)